MNLHQKIIILLVLACIDLSFSFATEYENSKDAIHNLKLNEINYHLFQDNYLSALTLEQMADRPDDSLIRNQYIWLESELGISFELHDQVDGLFEYLINASEIIETPSHLWIKFSKYYYERFAYKKSRLALSMVNKDISQDQKQDINILNANILINTGKLDKLRSGLNSKQKHDELWHFYVRYNLAVTLINAGNKNSGIALLKRLSDTNINPEDVYYNEISEIIDLANLFLGYQSLNDNHIASARSYFLKVKNNSNYHNQSLLGIGWADSRSGLDKQALETWRNLQTGNITDPAVQESFLTVAYTLDRLDAKQQALTNFKQAITIYDHEINHIDNLINQIKSDTLIDVVFDNELMIDQNRSISAADIKDPYIKTLYSNGRFSQALGQYLQLHELSNTIETRLNDIQAYRVHISNKKELYEDKLPDMIKQNRSASINKESEYKQYQNELNIIIKTNNAHALITEDEKRNSEILDLLDENISDLSRLFNLGRIDDKLRIYRGIILWDITLDYENRIKEYTATLNEIEDALRLLSENRKRLGLLQQDALIRFDALDNRLNSLESTATLLHINTTEAIDYLISKLDQIALENLNRQKSQYKNHKRQAYLAIAQMYESAYAAYQPEADK